MDVKTEESNYLKTDESSLKSDESSVNSEVTRACARDPLDMASASELTLQAEATNELTHSVADDITPTATKEPTHSVAGDLTSASIKEPTHSVADDITPASIKEPTHSVADDITSASIKEPTHSVADDITPTAIKEPTHSVTDDNTPASIKEPTHSVADDITPTATKESTHSVADDKTPASIKEPTHSVADDITPASIKEPTHSVADYITPASIKEPTHSVADDITPTAIKEPTHSVADDTPLSTTDRPNERSVKSRDFEFWYAPARSSDQQHGGNDQHGGHHQSEVRDQNASLEGNSTSHNDGASGAVDGSDDALSDAVCDGSKGLENDDHQKMNTKKHYGSMDKIPNSHDGINNDFLCGNVNLEEKGDTNGSNTDTLDSDTGETHSSDIGSANAEVPNISVTGSELEDSAQQTIDVCTLKFSTDVTAAKPNSCNDKPNESLAHSVTKPNKHTSTEQTKELSQLAEYVNIQQLKGNSANTVIICNASNNNDDLTNLGTNSRYYDKTNDKLLHFATNVNVSNDIITDLPQDANNSCDSGIFIGNLSDVTNESGDCDDTTYGLSHDDTNSEDSGAAFKSEPSSQESQAGRQETNAENNTEFKGQPLEDVLLEIQRQRDINRKRNEELKRSLEGKIASIPPEPLIFLDTDRKIHYDGHGKVIDVKVIDNKDSETNIPVNSERRTKEHRNARRKGEGHTEPNIRQCSYEPVSQPMMMRQTYVAAAPLSTQRTAVSAPLSTQRTAVSAPLSTQRTAVSAPLSIQRTAVSAPLSTQRTAVSASPSIQPAKKSAPQDGLENVEPVSSYRQVNKQAILHETNAQIEIVPRDRKPRAGIKQKEIVPHNENQEVSKPLKGRKRTFEDMKLRNLVNIKTSEVRHLPIHQTERDVSHLPVHQTEKQIAHLPVQQTTRDISRPLQATAPPWPGEPHHVVQPAPTPAPAPARSSSMTRLYPVLPTLLEGQEWSQRNAIPPYAIPQQEISNLALSTNPLSVIHKTTNPQHLNPHILITNEENTSTYPYNNFTSEVDPGADCVAPLADDTGDNYHVWYTGQQQLPLTGQPEDGTQHVFNGQPPLKFIPPNISKERSLKGQVPNYLPFSIIVTLLCCFPVGAVALCFAVQAKKEEKLGHLVPARRSASRARLFCAIAVILGMALYAVLLYFLITNVMKTMRSL